MVVESTPRRGNAWGGIVVDPPRFRGRRGSTAWGLAAASLILTACQTPRPAQVAIPIACVPATLPEKPKVLSPAELQAIKDNATFVPALGEAYLALWARSLETEPVIEACKQASADH